MSAEKRPQIVEVEWDDARSIYEQIELSAAVNKVLLVRRFTVGYLVHKDRERLIVAGTFDPAERKLDANRSLDEDGGADFTAIPRGWVKNITNLAPAGATEEPS